MVISQFVRANVTHPSPLPRLTDLAGFSLFPHLSSRLNRPTAAAVAAVVPIGYLAACRAGARLPAALDWYALIGVVAVIGMLLWPYGYWHALRRGRRAVHRAGPGPPGRPAAPRRAPLQIVPLIAVSLVAAVVISRWACASSPPRPSCTPRPALAAHADRLIPPGSCVLTNDSSLTVSASRFASATPGCPAMVDAYGTLLAMTDGRKMFASPRGALGHRAVEHGVRPRAVRVARNRQPGPDPVDRGPVRLLHRHFRLIGLVNGPGAHDVPKGGLYVRR